MLAISTGSFRVTASLKAPRKRIISPRRVNALTERFVLARTTRAALAARPLRWLVALSLVLPLAILAIAGWISYQQHFSDARDRLDRDLSRIYEHALKVFETFDLSARYVDELLDGVSNEEIRAEEAQFNAKLKALIDSLPQLRDIWVVDANGAVPLVSGSAFPMQKVDLSERTYFLRTKNRSARPFVSEVIEGRVGGLTIFCDQPSPRECRRLFQRRDGHLRAARIFHQLL